MLELILATVLSTVPVPLQVDPTVKAYRRVETLPVPPRPLRRAA